MPQTWASDNQRALDRLKIQHGLSMIYPTISITAHVGQVEIEKNAFNRSLNTAAMVAMGGNIGFEMDLSRLSGVEMEQVCGRESGGTFHIPEEKNGKQNDEEWRVFFRGLNEKAVYELQEGPWSSGSAAGKGRRYSGEILMKLGYRVLHGDFPNESHCFVFTIVGREKE